MNTSMKSIIRNGKASMWINSFTLYKWYQFLLSIHWNGSCDVCTMTWIQDADNDIHWKLIWLRLQTCISRFQTPHVTNRKRHDNGDKKGHTPQMFYICWTVRHQKLIVPDKAVCMNASHMERQNKKQTNLLTQRMGSIEGPVQCDKKFENSFSPGDHSCSTTMQLILKRVILHIFGQVNTVQHDCHPNG